jgi:anti-sigma B factor antagonist
LILDIERRHIDPDVDVLEMKGRIVMGNTSRDVEMTLTELLQGGATKIIFDLSQTASLDSTGIGILVVCHGRVSKVGGKLCLAGPSEFIRDMLRMTSVDKILKVYASVEEAVKNL